MRLWMQLLLPLWLRGSAENSNFRSDDWCLHLVFEEEEEEETQPSKQEQEKMATLVTWAALIV